MSERIQKIAGSLGRLKRHYNASLPHILEVREWDYQTEKENWFYTSLNESPFAKTLWHSGNTSIEYEREITLKVRDNDEGYFKYAEHNFSKFHMFLNKEFPEVIRQYFGNKVQAISLIDKMNDESQRLARTDFIKAVQYDLIYTFDLIETQYSKFYPKYERVLKPKDILINKANDYYIRITDSEKMNVIIETMYEELTKGSFISVPLNEFRKHFDPFCAIANTIQWKRQNNSLIYFLHQLNEERIISIPSSQSIPKYIVTHFVDEVGAPFLRESIDVNHSKIKTGKNVHHRKLIDNLITKLKKTGK